MLKNAWRKEPTRAWGKGSPVMKRACLLALLLLSCSVVDHRKEGLELYQQKKYAEAAEHLQKAAREDASLNLPLAESLYYTKNFGEADKAYQAYFQVTKNPGASALEHDAEGLGVLARASSKAGKGDECWGYLQRLARVKPDAPELSQPAQALQEARKALVADPRLAFYHASRARAARPQDREAMTLQVRASIQGLPLDQTEKVLSSVPPEVLGRIPVETRERLAQSYLAEYEKLNPVNDIEYETGLKLLDRAVALAPGLAKTYFQRAVLNYDRDRLLPGTSHDNKRVLADLRRAEKLGGVDGVSRLIELVQFEQERNQKLESLRQNAYSKPARTGLPEGGAKTFTQFYVLGERGDRMVLVALEGGYQLVAKKGSPRLTAGRWYYGRTGDGGNWVLLDGWEKKRPAVTSSPIIQDVQDPGQHTSTRQQTGTWFWDPYTPLGQAEFLSEVVVVREKSGLALIGPDKTLERPRTFDHLKLSLEKIGVKPGQALFLVGDKGPLLDSELRPLDQRAESD